MNPCLFLNWVCIYFVQFRLKVRQGLYRLFWVRIHYFVPLWKHPLWRKRRLRHCLRNVMSNLWKIRLKRQSEKTALSESLNFWSEPGLLFLPLWWSKKTNFCEIAPASFVYSRLKRPNVRESGLAVTKLLRCKNCVKMRNLDPGSRWKAHIGRNLPFWTLEKPQTTSASPVGE